MLFLYLLMISVGIALLAGLPPCAVSLSLDSYKHLLIWYCEVTLQLRILVTGRNTLR